MNEATAYEPSLLDNIRYAFQRFTDRFRKKPPSNLVEHGRRELIAMGMDPDSKEDGPNKWTAQGTLELLQVLADQGHCGGSINYAIETFATLARFKPLGPLTGEASEWMDHGNGVFQNIRCGRVFKQLDRFDGQPYDLNGQVFREPSGACYTNRESMTPIAFPYTPATVYVDVPEPKAA